MSFDRNRLRMLSGQARGFSWASAVVLLLLASATLQYAAADVGRAEMLAYGCAGCHGTNGVSRGPASPSIAGFDMRYLFRVMRQFKKGERVATIMGRLATAYTVKELRLIATHFAEKPWGNADVAIDKEKAVIGRRLHEELCEECHQKSGEDQDHEVPRLAGQWPTYLYMQLLDYRDLTEQMPQPDKMRNRIEGLSDSELESLSQFYAETR